MRRLMNYCNFKKVVNLSLARSRTFSQKSNVTVYPEKCPLENSGLTQATVEDVQDIARNLAPTFNLAAYINDSPHLQELIKLGVDLSKYDNKPELQKFMLKLNFKRDIKPYIEFLCDNGVPAEKIGKIFTKNIALCREPLDDLQIRVNYLEAKKFTKENIAEIITRNPLWLSQPVVKIDERLGWFQKTYNLTGDQVRSVINALPQIATFNLHTIKINNFMFEEEMCLEKWQIKKLLLKRPRLFVKNQKKLLSAFEYVRNEMNIPLDLICAQPDILMARISTIKERHLFLKSLGRAQYNPKLPGYICLNDFILSNDADFCEKYANSSVLSYNTFLKTL